jgi:hypothetical protein
MAKRLLLSVLVDVLGNYVEGLTVENLKLGVWSGKIELNNMKLKENALDALNLPISITHGSLCHISVKIPWTALESKPVKIEIDGVYLQAGPLDLSKLSPDQIRKSILLNKRAKLQEAEDFILINGDVTNKDPKESEKSSSYFRHLALKIIDNLEITLSNIHIRYEDSGISIPNRCLSAGLTIASLKLSTTDENWHEAFITRGKDAAATIIRKLGVLDNLGVYWNSNDENPLNGLSGQEWLSAMQDLIYGHVSPDSLTPASTPSTAMKPLDYLLAPPNSLSLKVVHRPHGTAEQPKVDTTIVSSQIVVNFDKIQYQQLLGVIATFSQLERYKQMSVYRPQVRPTVDAKVWWKYALKLVLGKDLSVANRIDIMIKSKKIRSHYIELVKLARKARLKNPGVIPAEDKEIGSIEDELPFATLVIFRKMAAIEMLKEPKAKKSMFSLSSPKASDTRSTTLSNPSAAAPAKSSSIFSSWFKKKDADAAPASTSSAHSLSALATSSDIDVDDEAEDDLLIENIQSQLHVEEDSKDEFPIHLKLETSANIHLLSSKQPIVDVMVSMRADVDVKAHRIALIFSLGNMIVEDVYTDSPVEKYLFRPRDLSSKDIPSGDQFKIVFESWPVAKRSSLTAGMIPMDITFNSECFQKILEIFIYQPPVIRSVRVGPTKSQILAAVSNYAKEITTGRAGTEAGTFSLSVDINSPNIVLPRNAKVDSMGYLVLDCGHFNLSGSISSSGVQLDAKIRGINIGSPDSASSRNDLQRLGLYLIKPFDVSVSIDNLNKAVAEMNIAFRIFPNIVADIDVSKLRRLIAIILNVSRTITQALGSAREEAEALSYDRQTFILHNRNYDDDHVNSEWLVDETAEEQKSPQSLASKSIAAPIEQRKDVFLSIAIESVVMNLTLSSSHKLDCVVSSLIIGILVSPFETTVTIDLKALSIDDSMRPQNFSRLVWTPPAEKSGSQLNFFHMGMVFFADKGSSQYRGYASEISLEFLCLGLDLDNNAILRLCPFFRELTRNFDDPDEMRPSVNLTEIKFVQTSKVGTSSSKPDPSESSLRLDITIENIMLNMVQPRKSIGFERLFALNMIGFDMQFESVEKSFMTMSIRNVDAIDTRHESENFYYKSLFTRSTLASEYGSIGSAAIRRTEESSDDLSLILQSSSNLASMKEDKIFHMTYSQESATVTKIDIDVQDVTTFLSPDSLLIFVNVLIADINALVAMIGSITKKSTDQPASESTLKLSVKVSNPRLLVLEDPTDKNSQAIVSKCRIFMSYTSDTTDITNDSLHVSLQDAEIFLLQGLSVGMPQQIVDPTSVEFNMKKTSAKSKVLSTRFAINVDTINMSLSFQDLLLTNSIVQRTIQIASAMDISTEDGVEVSELSSSSSIEKSVTLYEVLFQARSLNLIVINDYSSQNLPVLRFQIIKTDVQSKGPVFEMEGEGSFIFSADYYNAKLTCYEPIVEPWCPEISLSTDMNSVIIEVSNEKTLQLNVSGSLTRTLLDCSNLLTIALDSYRRSHRKQDSIQSAVNTAMNFQSYRIAPPLPHEASSRYASAKKGRPEDIPIVFINSLGVPINIVEHRTKSVIVSMGSVSREPVYRTALQSLHAGNNPMSFQRKRDTLSNLPNYFDVHIIGELQNAYQPLFQLPLNINTARAFYLHYKTSTISSPRSSPSPSIVLNNPQSRQIVPQPKGPKTSTLFHGEEVIEEIYENSRYDVVTRKWGKPWHNFGDPEEYTDTKGRPSVPPLEKALPSDKWEWVESGWRVDMVGVVGRDIDEQGYEYNINFVNFSVKKRRTFQPLDSVRRRKWVRTRRLIPNLPKVSEATSPRNPISPPSNLWISNSQCQTGSAGEQSTPIAIFWDVRLQADGSRNIFIRSGFSVTNSMRFPLDIRLGGFSSQSADQGSCIFGPIAPGDVFYFPINKLHASTVEFRPSTVNCVEFAWSIALDCRVRDSYSKQKSSSSADNTQLFFVDCNILRGAAVTSMSDMSKNVKNRVFMRTIFDYSSDKGVNIECAPFAVLYNRLPSSFAFKCLSGDVKEHGIVTPATQYEFVYTNPTLQPTISIQLGTYIWSNPRPFDQGQYLLDLVSPFKSTEGINLSMSVTSNTSSGLVEILIYSKYALIDRTGLNMSIQTRRFSEKQISYDVSANNSVTFVPNTQLDAPSNFMEVNNTLERRTYDESEEGSGTIDAMSSWTTGGNGVVLFQSANDSAVLGFKKGKVWSFSISLVSLGSTMSALEVLDKETKKVFQLAYQIVPLPFIFQETQGLIVMPWYRIVNCMDESIEIRQFGEHSSQIINAQMSEGCHRSDGNKETKLQFKTSSSMWSLGAVDINEIGTNVLLIPGGTSHPTTNTGSDTILLHVEVKLADSGDLSYMTILVWKETTEAKSQWTLSVRNDTILPITIRQDMKDSIKDPESLSKFEICYEPQHWLPFGWADQAISSNIVACVGTTLQATNPSLCCSINMLKLGEASYLSLDSVAPEYAGEQIKFILQAVGSGKVLHISQISKKMISSDRSSSPVNEMAYQKEIKLYFRSVGVSVIAERPTRREFFSCYVEDVEASIVMIDATSTQAGTNSFEFKIHDIQVDNYSESAVYPVMLHSFDSAIRKKANRSARYKKASNSSDEDQLESLHFFQFAVIQERPLGWETMIFKYIALRVLELKAAIDSSTIQLYLLDIHNDLIGESIHHDQFRDLSGK